MAKPADSRAAVLGAIRASLGRPGLSGDATRELEARMAAHRPNLIPARAQLEGAELIALFVRMAEAAACTVEPLPNPDRLPAAVAEYLRAHNLPALLALAPEPWLQELPWQEQPTLEVKSGRPDGSEAAALTPAFAGIAETGTLMLLSDPRHPTTLNFLPDHHLVVLRKSQIVGPYETAWQWLRDRQAAAGEPLLPRTVNLVTGPSRTGDIELAIHLGAHGPRSLHILLLDDERQ